VGAAMATVPELIVRASPAAMASADATAAAAPLGRLRANISDPRRRAEREAGKG